MITACPFCHRPEPSVRHWAAARLGRCPGTGAGGNGPQRPAQGRHGAVVHQCPPAGQDIMPCCGEPVEDLGASDRLTSDPSAVTCRRTGCAACAAGDECMDHDEAWLLGLCAAGDHDPVTRGRRRVCRRCRKAVAVRDDQSGSEEDHE